MAEGVPIQKVLEKMQAIVGQQALQIAALQATVEALQARVAELEELLKQREMDDNASVDGEAAGE